MLNETNTFTILNSTGLEMDIIHEPECFEFTLPIDNEVTIATNACEESIQLRIGVAEGKTLISILSNKSLYEVHHQGVDVFKELVE